MRPGWKVVVILLVIVLSSNKSISESRAISLRQIFRRPEPPGSLGQQPLAARGPSAWSFPSLRAGPRRIVFLLACVLCC